MARLRESFILGRLHLIRVLLCLFAGTTYGELLDPTQSIKPKGVVPSLPKNERPKPAAPAKEEKKKKPQKQPLSPAEDEGPFKLEGESSYGNRFKGFLVLEKDVRVYRGTFELKADKAHLTSTAGTEKFNKIKAIGNVYIKKLDPQTQELVEAYGDEAEYDTVSGKIVLEGKNGNARLQRGDSSFEGDIINYNLKTGWVKTGPVKGFLSPSREKTKP